jgi:hypothetical protein
MRTKLTRTSLSVGLVFASLSLARTAAVQAPKKAGTAQAATPAPTSIVVRIAGKPDSVLSAEDLAKMPQHTMRVKVHEKEVEYQGVFLADILKSVGTPMGKDLRGKALSSYVLATARDGYQIVYSLAELDPALTEGDALIAEKSDGKPLGPTHGPFQIVMPHDKRPARSVRMLERIDILQLRR